MKKVQLILAMVVAIMVFNCNYHEDFTTTITRAVGPTTLVGKRGTLPQTTPTDLNTVFANSVTGNDANAGTSASPKESIDGAILALGGGKTTIQCAGVGTGYVWTSTNPLPLNTNIQVEDGGMAYSFGGQPSLAGGNTVNGLVVTNNAINVLTILGTGCVLDNVLLLDSLNSRLGNLVDGTGFALKTINYSFIGACLTSNAAGTSDVILNNTIQVIGANAVDASIPAFETGIAAASTVTNVLAHNSILIGRGQFATADAVIPRPLNRIAMTGTPVTYTFTATDTYLDYPGQTFVYENAVASRTIVLTESRNYCLRLSDTGFYFAGTVAATELDTATETNIIPPTTQPLFVDYQGAIDEANDPNNTVLAMFSGYNVPEFFFPGFRLQFAGRDTPTGGRYLINSPLIGAGLSGDDVNPWEEATTGPARIYDTLVTINFPPRSVQQTWEYVNPVTKSDIRGGIHTAFDGRRRNWLWNFGADTDYQNEQDFKKLVQLTFDTGTQLLYPLAPGQTLFINPRTGVPDTTGVFDSADNSFAPIIANGVPLKPFNWRGYIITVNGNDYYIESNDTAKFYLIAKYGAAFPTNGQYSFTIEKILGRWSLDEQVSKALEWFRHDYLEGSGIREYIDNPTDTSYLMLEGKATTLRFIEAIDPDEAV